MIWKLIGHGRNNLITKLSNPGFHLINEDCSNSWQRNCNSWIIIYFLWNMVPSALSLTSLRTMLTGRQQRALPAIMASVRAANLANSPCRLEIAEVFGILCDKGGLAWALPNGQLFLHLSPFSGIFGQPLICIFVETTPCLKAIINRRWLKETAWTIKRERGEGELSEWQRDFSHLKPLKGQFAK